MCIEPPGQDFPDAEIRCLSRLLSCLSSQCRPLMISGVSSLVSAFYDDSNKKHGKFLSYAEYSPEVFVEQIQKVGGSVFGLIDPFT